METTLPGVLPEPPSPLLPPMQDKLRLLSPKPGDFLVLSVESEGEAEFYAEQFGAMFADGRLDPKVNLMILPAGKTIELLTDEELDVYGLERTEVEEDEA